MTRLRQGYGGLILPEREIVPPSTCEMFMATHLAGFGAGDSGFSVLGVDFKGGGTPDYYARTSAWTGIADTAQMWGSFWARFDGSDGISEAIFDQTDAGGNQFYVARASTNKLRIVGLNTGASATFNIEGSTNLTNAAFGSAWVHVAFSINWASLPLAANTLIYVNGAADTVTDTSNAAGGNFQLTGTAWRLANTVGSVPGGAFDGCLAEFIWGPGETNNLSIAANLAKLRSPAGKPVDVGSNGSLPTGAQPRVYCSVRPGDAVSAFATNRGSGGNFDTTGGTPALSSTNP